jgi:hypothetical protein
MTLRIKKILTCPFLVFQMGKVGSKAVAATIAQKSPALVLQYHSVDMLTPAQRFIIEGRRILGLPLKIISPIRDPISRNLSAFFENFIRDTGLPYNQMPTDLAKLRSLFLDRYPHHVGLEWFDRHLRPAFGLDVYSEDFPWAAGYKIYRRGCLELLVYRIDVEREIQLDLIAKFTGLKLDTWVRVNEAEQKVYAETYRRASQDLMLPSAYVSRMISSRYCQHFWTPTEIVAMRGRWEDPSEMADRSTDGST